MTHRKNHYNDASGPMIGRRSLLKAAVAAAPLVMAARKTEAQVTPLPSSPVIPLANQFVEELPQQDTPLEPLPSLTPMPTVMANTGGGECGRAPHQRYDELFGPTGLFPYSPLLYQLTAKERANWVFNAFYPPQPIWGYYPGNLSENVVTPGPTIHARYGQPILCRIRNELPVNHVGFGSPEISTHLHNMHTPSESDGFAGDYYSATRAGPTLTAAGSFNDHCYPNLYAGFQDAPDPLVPEFVAGEREALGSLFYHDHTEGVTAPNVLKGLMGHYNIYDHIDTGDESTGLRLPSGPYDYPLTFSDKRFNADGVLTFDQLAPEGVLGDRIVVNGKIAPMLRVARRKYRFRLLNAGPSRFYELYLQNRAGTTVYTFSVIANDGNLLPAPVTALQARFAPAERIDIVIDFARFPLNTELYLVNQLVQVTTREPTGVQAPGTRVLKFIVDRNVAEDPSRVPTTLRALRPLPSTAQLNALRVRTFNFERSSGMWSINGRFFNSLVPIETVQRGSTEIWELINLDNGWQHPIHIHFEEGRILSKTTVNGSPVPIPVIERGRKDVFVLGRLMRVRVLMRFRDFTGKYMMHCHNLTHEDHAMMLRFDIV